VPGIEADLEVPPKGTLHALLKQSHSPSGSLGSRARAHLDKTVATVPRTSPVAQRSCSPLGCSLSLFFFIKITGKESAACFNNYLVPCQTLWLHLKTFSSLSINTGDCVICHKVADGGGGKRERSGLRTVTYTCLVCSPAMIPRWGGLACVCRPVCCHSISRVPAEPSQSTVLYTRGKHDVHALCDSSQVTRQSVPHPGSFMF